MNAVLEQFRSYRGRMSKINTDHVPIKQQDRWRWRLAKWLHEQVELHQWVCEDCEHCNSSDMTSWLQSYNSMKHDPTLDLPDQYEFPILQNADVVAVQVQITTYLMWDVEQDVPPNNTFEERRHRRWRIAKWLHQQMRPHRRTCGGCNDCENPLVKTWLGTYEELKEEMQFHDICGLTDNR